MEDFEALLDPAERQLVASLDSPARIQAFLDETPYSAEDANRCPLRVLRERKAHCLDGGLFAAATLRRLGFPPLIVDLLPEPGLDDDHVLAIYRLSGRYGAVAKSNFSGLRFREPVYRNLRELVMSYFEDFFNQQGQRTMRGYTRPVNLAAYDRLDWMTRDSGADAIEKRLYRLKCIPVLTLEMAAALHPLDALSFQAGMLGTNPAGLYRPKA
ncbi:MAG: hypothetical protein GYA59_02710 [Chloroflexi bacterium]|nr:hypothetical protein [Chloroflexota bacterium]